MHTKAQQLERLNGLLHESRTDDALRGSLLQEPASVLTRCGVELPHGVTIQVTEDTESVMHFVLPTKENLDGLSSEYLRTLPMYPLISRALDDPGFKARLLADPTPVLGEYGLSIPSGARPRVLENTDTVLNLALPARRDSSELSLDRLDQVVGGAGDVNGITFGITDVTYSGELTGFTSPVAKFGSFI